MDFTTILLIVIILLSSYKFIEYLVEKNSFSLVHPLKGVMNGTKPYFIIGDLPLQTLLHIKPKLKQFGEIYFRWFFWYPIVEIKNVNALQYVFNERSNNFSLYWNLGKSRSFLLTGSEIKRFFRIYYCALNCKDSLSRIMPVIRQQSFNFTNSSLFQNLTLSSDKELTNFMLKLLGRVYLGSGDEAFDCIKANYKKFNRSKLDFIHYLFPALLRIPSKFSMRYKKNKQRRMIYQILAMKAYYNVVRQSPDDTIEDSMLNIIAETSYNDKEGLSLDEIKMPTYLLNASSINGPMILLKTLMFTLMDNPEVESKIRKEISSVFEKNGSTLQNFTLNDIMEMNYLEATLDEVNRMYPPFPKLVPRLTKESDRIMGYHIPKGTMISCPVADILRDPNIIKNPDQFKPERQLKFSTNPKFASPSITSIHQLNKNSSGNEISGSLAYKSNSTAAVTNIHPSISHGNRLEQLRNDPLNIASMNVQTLPSSPPVAPLPSRHELRIPQHHIKTNSCPMMNSSTNSSSSSIPNIFEINKNNPISNNQYNSYSNLTIEERNERIVKNLPWGIGSKKCLGKEFAKVIVKTIVIVLYSQYTFEKQEDNDDCLSSTPCATAKPKIEMIFNPEIKPPLRFKSRKLTTSKIPTQ